MYEIPLILIIIYFLHTKSCELSMLFFCWYALIAKSLFSPDSQIES